MGAEQTIHLEKYAADAKALVAGAQALADERKHGQVEPLHLLSRAIERDRGVQEVFKKAGVSATDIAVETETQLGRLPKTQGGLAYLSTATLQLLGRAEKEADKSAVGVDHLLNALSQEIRGPAAVVLQAFGLGPGSLRPHMEALKSVPREIPVASNGGGGASSDGGAPKFTNDLTARAREGLIDPVIGRDLEVRRLLQILERRQKNHPLLVGEAGVGKTAIIGALATRIAQGDVPHNLSGFVLHELEVGSLMAGAKLRGEVEERLKQVLALVKQKDTVLVIDGLESLLGQGAAGSSVGDLLKPLLARGEVRLLATTTPEGVRKLQEKDPNLLRRFTVLGIDPPTPEKAIEILRGIATRFETYHNVQIGDPAVVAAVRLAKRYVQDRELPDNAIDLLDEAAARKRVELDGVPAHMDDAIRRLASLKAQLAGLMDDEDAMSKKSKERIDKEIKELEPTVSEMRVKLDSKRGAAAAAQALREEYTKLQAQLEEARKTHNFAKLGELEHVQIPDVKRRLEAAEAAVARDNSGTSTSRVVGEEDVAVVLGDWTGIPIARMLEAESEKLLKMEDRLTKRVVGQEEAVRAVSKAVRRGRVGLRDPGKPIGSFLFLGPSGVGKTELAKALAEFLFDDEQSMTRLDMSEFMEKHMAQRLVGAPPGYVDSEEGGFLTEAVRRKPYSVLLFDEVEKAHADVFNLLLQVLDDGRLTDGRGRTADFSNTVVIMTSNIGSQRILETDPKLFESAEGREALRDVLREELKNFLRPEFLNRIDDVIIFRPLSKDDLTGIVDIQLVRLEKLLVDRELKLELLPAARTRLVDLGYEPAFGARPLKRAILKNVQDPLAEEILAGGYPPGAVVRVDVKDETFTFSKG
ncbi:MAG: AAA family ATPase [Polyangiaceae bacterium]|jgi:ATP-dependent Clp protease ATP-binding subunit ClpB